MSSDAPPTQTPDMKSKKKKDKASTEKKRKREEDQQDVSAVTPAEPNRKKSKKQKHQGDPVIPPTPAASEALKPANTLGWEAKGEKKAKKRKQDGAAKAVPIEDGVDTEATPAKKRKKQDEQPPERPSAALASSSKQLQIKRTNQPPAEQLSSGQLLEKYSPFQQKTQSFYLTLSPCANAFPLEGLIAEHISPLLLTYSPQLGGVVLRYDNARLSEDPDVVPSIEGGERREAVLGKAVDEYAVTYVWLTADFTLFTPKRGTWLEGYVNLQNESLLGLVCYNYFNAGIESKYLPKDWQWVSEGDPEMNTTHWRGAKSKQGNGYWVNGSGEKVEGRLVFRVRDFEATPGSESGAGSISIFGGLLSDEDERRVEDEERQQGLVSQRRR